MYAKLTAIDPEAQERETYEVQSETGERWTVVRDTVRDTFRLESGTHSGVMPESVVRYLRACDFDADRRQIETAAR